MKNKCSIIIRAYNEEKHIGRLLEGITRQSLQDVEIVLVDSGSTDATVSIASRFPVRVVHISPQDFTFGRSLNRGIAAAQGEFVVIASAHVYPVYPDWLERMLRPFDDPQVALVYGKQRGNSTTKFSEHQIFAKLYPETSVAVQKTPICNNANAAIRKSLWERRPYDEELTGLEDMEWAAWALSQGFHLSYSAEAEVIHVHDETPRQVFNRYRREAIALKRIRPEEHFHLWDFLALLGSNVFIDLWHALRSRAGLGAAGEILTFRLMQFWGTYRGFSHRGPLSVPLKQAFYYPRALRLGDPPTAREVDPIDYHEGLDDV